MRFGNQVKAYQWDQLCICNAPGAGWTVCQQDLSGNKTSSGAGGVNIFLDFPIPSCAERVTGTVYPDSCPNGNLVSMLIGYKSLGGSYVVTNSIVNHSPCEAQTLVTLNIDRTIMGSIFLQANYGAGSGTGNWHGLLYWEHDNSLPLPAPPPPLVSPPTGYPSPPSAPTCGTSQDVCNLLNTINNKLDWQRQQVDLIQRQAVPFAYLKGTARTGLTGSGSFAVSGILGLSVSLTSVPSGWGRSSDNPNRYIPSPGSVVATTADGAITPLWCNEPDSLLLDSIMGSVTTVKYGFKPGVVATITELRREP
jgi:hypothetical protein